MAPAEREVLATLTVEKRRRDWLLGRWLAKGVALEWLRRRGRLVPLAGMEVLGAPDGAPELRIHSAPEAPAAGISISHARGMGFAALLEGSAGLGCDVERVEPRSPVFVEDYLVPAERAVVASAVTDHGRALAANLVWSAKESALKLLRCGLRADTRSVVVELPTGPGGPGAGAGEGAWRPLLVRTGGEDLPGWWLWNGAFVWTLVSREALAMPDPARIPLRRAS